MKDTIKLALEHIAEIGREAARMQRDLDRDVGRMAARLIRDLKAVAETAYAVTKADPLPIAAELKRIGMNARAVLEGPRAGTAEDTAHTMKTPTPAAPDLNDSLTRVKINEMLREHAKETIFLREVGRPWSIPATTSDPRASNDQPEGHGFGLLSVPEPLRATLELNRFIMNPGVIRLDKEIKEDFLSIDRHLKDVVKSGAFEVRRLLSDVVADANAWRKNWIEGLHYLEKGPARTPGPAVPPGPIVPVFVTNWSAELGKQSGRINDFLKSVVDGFGGAVGAEIFKLVKKIPKRLPEDIDDVLPQGEDAHGALAAKANSVLRQQYAVATHSSSSDYMELTALLGAEKNRPINIEIYIQGDRVITRTDAMRHQIKTRLKRGRQFPEEI